MRTVYRRLVLGTACALAAALLARYAAAEDKPFLQLRMGTTLTLDANVFRVSDIAPDPQLSRGISGKADQYRTGFIGLTLDKTYAQQHFAADATRTYTRYEKFVTLDRNAYDYHGEWDWHLGPRFNGTLSALRDESIVGFDDTQSTTLNKRITSTRVASIDGWVYGNWHLLSSFTNSQSTLSQLFFAQPSSNVNSGEIGLKYLVDLERFIAVTERSRRGVNNLPHGVDFLNVIDTDFTVQESEMQAAWKLGGASTLNGRLTHIDRENLHLPQRDFSVNAGELGYTWKPTGKLVFKLYGTRNIQPWTANTQASYRVDDILVFTPSWQVTDKIKLNMNPSITVTDFRGPVAPLTGPPRRDIVRAVTFTAEWSPARATLLSATLQRIQRASTNSAFEFKDSIATLNASLKF